MGIHNRNIDNTVGELLRPNRINASAAPAALVAAICAAHGQLG